MGRQAGGKCMSRTKEVAFGKVWVQEERVSVFHD